MKRKVVIYASWKEQMKELCKDIKDAKKGYGRLNNNNYINYLMKEYFFLKIE